MTQPDDDKSGRTFTQDDLNKAAAAAADRVRRQLESKYGDYDHLKKAAEAAAGSKSQLDKIETALAQANARAEKAEREALRSSVAQELKLTARQARKLEGSTREEMLADGREMVEDFGIKPEGKGADTDAGKLAVGVEGQDGNASTADGGTGSADDGSQPTRRGRPKETQALQTGATMSDPKAEEMDPRKLAESVARRF